MMLLEDVVRIVQFLDRSENISNGAKFLVFLPGNADIKKLAQELDDCMPVNEEYDELWVVD